MKLQTMRAWAALICFITMTLDAYLYFRVTQLGLSGTVPAICGGVGTICLVAIWCFND